MITKYPSYILKKMQSDKKTKNWRIRVERNVRTEIERKEGEEKVERKEIDFTIFVYKNKRDYNHVYSVKRAQKNIKFLLCDLDFRRTCNVLMCC